MKTTRRSATVLPFHRLALTAAALALVALAGVAGCKKHTEGDGHDHPKTPAKADEHAGHDHGGGNEAAHVDEVKLTADAVARYGITSAEAQRWVLKPTVVAPARVAFNTEAMAHVGSPLRGRAVEIMVREGDSVKSGQALVTVESPELGEAQADFLQKRTAVEAAGPAAELAKVSWERAKAFYEQSQGVSLTEVQKREAEYRAAIAGVKGLIGAALAAEHRLNLLGMKPEAVATLVSTGTIAPRHTITAPIDGVVIEREVTLGELVGPDRESMLVLADTRVLWVLADVPEVRLTGIARGAKAWVTVGSEGGVQPFEGTVAFVALQVDQATRAAQVRVEVPAAQFALRPGMFAQVEIVVSEPGGTDPAPVIAVPGESIQTVEGGPAVFVPVAGEPNTFAKRAVTIGKPIGGLVPVYSGLVEGERYVSGGGGSFILKAELGKGSAAHEH